MSNYEDINPEKRIVGVITQNHGGVCWVRDVLRHDPIVLIKPMKMSGYWKKVENYMFRRR